MTPYPLRAFLGSQELKNKYLERVRQHAVNKRFYGRMTWTGQYGTAVGCTIESSAYGLYELELGIPEFLAHIEDCLYSRSDGKWAEEFLEAITPGADLSGVWSPMALWLLEEKPYGVIHYTSGELAEAITLVADFYRKGYSPDSEMWETARRVMSQAPGTSTFDGPGDYAKYTAEAVVEAVKDPEYTALALERASECEARRAEAQAKSAARFGHRTEAGNQANNAARQAAGERYKQKLLELLRSVPTAN